MNTSKLIPTIAGLALLGFTAVGADKIVGGPKGGRLLENEAPRAEFFVEKDHTVTITFYDAALKVVPPGDQVVTATAEAKSGKAKLEFEKKGDTLVSKTALPEGDGYNVVVQIKAKPDAKPQNFRVKFDTGTCGECKRAEYACICGH
jgi:CheY-like chemotaxis protein